jgi:hypothetical protein
MKALKKKKKKSTAEVMKRSEEDSYNRQKYKKTNIFSPLPMKETGNTKSKLYLFPLLVKETGTQNKLSKKKKKYV